MVWGGVGGVVWRLQFPLSRTLITLITLITPSFGEGCHPGVTPPSKTNLPKIHPINILVHDAAVSHVSPLLLKKNELTSKHSYACLIKKKKSG